MANELMVNEQNGLVERVYAQQIIPALRRQRVIAALYDQTYMMGMMNSGKNQTVPVYDKKPSVRPIGKSTTYTDAEDVAPTMKEISFGEIMGTKVPAPDEEYTQLTNKDGLASFLQGGFEVMYDFFNQEGADQWVNFGTVVGSPLVESFST